MMLPNQNLKNSKMCPSLIDYQSKPSTSDDKKRKDTLTPKGIANGMKICEFCKKSLEPEKFLKHIGNSKGCKAHYGPRFSKMKRKRLAKRKQISYRKRTSKQRENLNQKRKEANAIRSKKLLDLASKGLDCNGVAKEEIIEDDLDEYKAQCGFCKDIFDIWSILKHIGNTEPCKIFYGPGFKEWKKDHKKKRMRYYREKNGTKKELEQQRKSYASNEKVRENKKKYHEKWRKEQEFLEQDRMKTETCHRVLKMKEDYARKESSEGYKWLHKCFAKVFEEYKSFDNVTKEKIENIENSIKEKQIKIDAEIEYKVEKWKVEMERGCNDIKVLIPILEDFATGHLYQNYGKPLNEQNRIKLIWHELKQNIEVKFEAISEEMGISFDRIPWHNYVCSVCNIYRDKSTGKKYLPPRFASEQDPEMIV